MMKFVYDVVDLSHSSDGYYYGKAEEADMDYNVNINLNGAGNGNAGYNPPVQQLKTNRGLLKFLLLGIITFGIYPIVVMSAISTDINTIASRYDGKKTMHYCLVLFIFSWLTFGIVPLVWCHNLCSRMGNELMRRRIPYSFGAGTFWGWCILGTLIYVGPFVYTYKLLHAMNLLCADYNVNG